MWWGHKGNGGRKGSGCGGDRGGNGGCKSSGFGVDRVGGGMAGVRAPEVVGTEAVGKRRV